MKIVCVADQFVEDTPYGGAEITTEVLLKYSPYPIVKCYSDELTPQFISEHADDFWIFANFFNVSPKLIPLLIEQIRYSVLEYDYKLCTHRAMQLHESKSGSPCNCHKTPRGILILYFLRFASTIWWMSEAQRDVYLARAPFLLETNNHVISSVFDDESLDLIAELRESARERKSWLILNSPSWIKNVEGAETWCRENNLPFEKVWGLSHAEFLKKLSQAEGLVYLPKDGDTCPRMVIEAKLLNCKLELNDKVQHANEAWFQQEIPLIESYLRSAPECFWQRISHDIETHRINTKLLQSAP